MERGHTIDVPGGALQELAGAAYGVLGRGLAVLAFVGVWVGAGVAWGVLLGLTFGWVPAVIAAVLVRYLWPGVLVVGVVLYRAWG